MGEKKIKESAEMEVRHIMSIVIVPLIFHHLAANTAKV